MPFQQRSHSFQKNLLPFHLLDNGPKYRPVCSRIDTHAGRSDALQLLQKPVAQLIH